MDPRRESINGKNQLMYIINHHERRLAGWNLRPPIRSAISAAKSVRRARAPPSTALQYGVLVVVFVARQRILHGLRLRTAIIEKWEGSWNGKSARFVTSLADSSRDAEVNNFLAGQ